MPSYYEALPVHKAAMDVAVRVEAVVQPLAKEHHRGQPDPCGSVKRQRLAYRWKPPSDAEAKPEESK